MQTTLKEIPKTETTNYFFHRLPSFNFNDKFLRLNA